MRANGRDIVGAFRDRHAFRPGQPLSLAPDPAHVHLFDADTGARLA